MNKIKAIAIHLRNLLRKEFDGLYITGYVRNKNCRELVIISNSSLPKMEAIIDYQYNAHKIASDNNSWTDYNIICNDDTIVFLRLHSYDNKNTRQELIDYYKK